LWTGVSLRSSLLASEKLAIALVAAASVALRVIPELAAYPHPIGYDVVNYYIPVVTNFAEHWPQTAGQFPLYVTLLYLVHAATGLSAHLTVVSAAVATFGAFALSIFFASRSILKLGVPQSAFVAIFVIFQMAVLRTAWDLHRDVFALTTMLLAFCLISRQDLGRKGMVALFALAGLTVAADRMIGLLFCISLIAYAVIVRSKKAVAPAIFAAGTFAILMAASNVSSGVTAAGGGTSASAIPDFYNQQNLAILFAVVNGLLVLPGIAGFMRAKGSLLKIPLAISLAGSLSWLAFPDAVSLVADRWTVLAGIFLSIFAAYGILHLAKKMYAKMAPVVAGSVLAGFAIIGLGYALMPYDSPFPLYGAARAYVENFGPVTMQFNSLDIQDNGRMLSAISWLNENTEPDAVIVGEKHWRGFMELHLQNERTYRFSGDSGALAHALASKIDRPVYFFEFDGSTFRAEKLT
jgi:hypothetical protein